MRTRTNINFGSGESCGIKIMQNYCAAGRVNVIYDDRNRAENFCKELTAAGYKADLKHFSDAKFRSRGFTVGLGGEEVIYAVKECEKEKFAFFTDRIIPELITGRSGELAEFAYIDTDKFNADNGAAVADCFTALFCVFTDGLAVAYYDKKSPFSDKGLNAVLRQAKNILCGNSDREEFFKEATRSMARIVDCLQLRNIDEPLTLRLARKMGGGLKNRISSAYFLNRLLILFTKWNFRDMLIPAERAVDGVEAGYPHYGVGDLLLKEADLKSISSKIRPYSEKPDLKKLVHALKAAINGQNPLFAEIYNRGIPEGIIDYG